MDDHSFMAQVKVYYDQIGNTLTVWFSDPQDEYICTETGEDIILMKDMAGQVIGLEKINYTPPNPNNIRFSFETISG